MSRCKIVSTGSYVPTKLVTNKDLEKIWDTSDEWIQQRSGIKERRWISEGDTQLNMAVKASKLALEKANLKPDDIDMIIFTALFSDYTFPGSGVLIQRELGMTKNIPALDTRNQCSGYLYSLSVADAWISTGKYKRILLVASEVHSTSFDYKNDSGRNVGVLFGDGAAATILEESTDESGVIDTVLHSQGSHAETLALLKPSPNDMPRVPESPNMSSGFFPVMDGKTVFKNAVTRMPEVIHEICEKNGFSIEDIDFVIAHQANQRINDMVLKNLKIPQEKTHNTLGHLGNTTACTIPITFNEARELGKIKDGDLVCFVAFGAGFTWGASLVRV